MATDFGDSSLITLAGLERARVDAARLREVGLKLTSVAMDHPELTGDPQLLTELGEVLEVLGFRTRERVRREASARLERAASRRGAAGAGAEFNLSRSEIEQADRLPRAHRVAPEPTCGGAPGTERGYRRHLTTYQTPCGACLSWRTDQLRRRWRRLGVDPESEVVLPA